MILFGGFLIMWFLVVRFEVSLMDEFRLCVIVIGLSMILLFVFMVVIVRFVLLKISVLGGIVSVLVIVGRFRFSCVVLLGSSLLLVLFMVSCISMLLELVEMVCEVVCMVVV